MQIFHWLPKTEEDYHPFLRHSVWSFNLIVFLLQWAFITPIPNHWPWEPHLVPTSLSKFSLVIYYHTEHVLTSWLVSVTSIKFYNPLVLNDAHVVTELARFSSLATQHTCLSQLWPILYSPFVPPCREYKILLDKNKSCNLNLGLCRLPRNFIPMLKH